MSVDAFLAAYPPPLVGIANALRAIVKSTLPEAVERVRAGWGLLGYDLPVGRRHVYSAFIWLEPADFHVHLGFEHGVLFDDPAGMLEGRGITKQVRWLTWRPGDAVGAAVAAGFLRQAERHAHVPGSMRRAAMLERQAEGS
jgi:hypothetical protein